MFHFAPTILFNEIGIIIISFLQKKRAGDVVNSRLRARSWAGLYLMWKFCLCVPGTGNPEMNDKDFV